ncbi:MAG: TatD family hydrolase [bacterium]|nr:TatD family hydrolase [bacterium]
MLIDTHCHLNFKDFDSDRDEIIERCLKNGIEIINIGVNYKTSQEVIKITQKYKKGVYATVALHPHDVTGCLSAEVLTKAGEKREREEFDYDKFLKLAKNRKVVAIGETGLDYAFCESDEKAQKLQQEVFIKHLELAKEVNKPVVIHSRRLFPEILKIIKKHRTSNSELRGVLHCYMGRWSYAEEYLKLGFYISFTGLITYARDYDKVIKNTPLDRILIETDAPYLAPEPLRQAQGKPVRNEPKYVEYVARKIAEIKGVSFEKVAEQTTQNAKELFNLL